MNNLYFICRSCKSMTDAGYRWAYWKLEAPGICTRHARVDVARVVAVRDYWDDPTLAPAQRELLAFVRTFLAEHADHELIWGEEEDVVDLDTVEVLDWLEVGPWASPTLRGLVAKLPVPTWDELCILVGAHADQRPWWWGVIPEVEVRRAFERLRAAASPTPASS